MRCDLQAAGTIELYFYGELPQGERVAVQAHLNGCAECRAALEDLSVIRRALASRPDVATPPGGDWSGFMRRLNAAVAAQQSHADAGIATPTVVTPLRRQLMPYMALAATLALVTIAVITVQNRRPAPESSAGRAEGTIPALPAPEAVQPVRHASLSTNPDPGLLAVRAVEAGRARAGDEDRPSGRLGVRTRARLVFARRYQAVSAGGGRTWHAAACRRHERSGAGAVTGIDGRPAHRGIAASAAAIDPAA
jgi:Putative zinc-finger